MGISFWFWHSLPFLLIRHEDKSLPLCPDGTVKSCNQSMELDLALAKSHSSWFQPQTVFRNATQVKKAQRVLDAGYWVLRDLTTEDTESSEDLNNASLGPAPPEQDPFHGAGSNGEGIFQPPNFESSVLFVVNLSALPLRSLRESPSGCWVLIPGFWIQPQKAQNHQNSLISQLAPTALHSPLGSMVLWGFNHLSISYTSPVREAILFRR